MKLIIGKNSKIVKDIKDELIGFDVKSHTEIDAINFDEYETVFLFSWSHANQLENIDLISRIPTEKLVFISTTAVFSTIIRNQWAAYPKNKLECENSIIESGGSILRIGVWDNKLKKSIYGTYQKTTKELLVNELNNWMNNEQRIANVYCLEEGGLSARKKWLGKRLRHLSLLFPTNILFQIPFVLVGRCIGISNYGYTGDAISCCQKVLQIGYGAFGGYLFKAKKSEIDMVVYSPNRSISLNGNGFNNTLIGKDKHGLSNDWHGVYVKKRNGLWKKYILWNKRNKPLSKNVSIEANVCEVARDGDYFRCEIDVGSPITHQYYGKKNIRLQNKFELVCRKLIMAAGAIENARLLNSIEKFDVEFDDHELSLLGEVDCAEVYGKYLSKFMCFSRNISSCILKIGDSEILLDFRPYVNAKKIDNLAFYNTKSASVVMKIITQFSRERLNEAFFNRFKICVATAKYQVYGQLLSRKCIHYNSDTGLNRKRVSVKEWDCVQSIVRNNFPTFNSYEINKTIDSLHTWSSQSLNECEIISKLINDGSLLVFGSPNDKLKLSCRHHTQEFRHAALMNTPTNFWAG